MGIEIDFSAYATAGDDANADGALDPDQVHFQFLCTTGDGGHDPEGSPDDHVRPMHAALHGTVWRLDDPLAPVPPLDYGCRCAMRHVGKPHSFAARVLQADSTTLPVPRGTAYATWLDANVDGWAAIASEVAQSPPAIRIAVAIELAKKAGMRNPTDVGRMIADTMPAEGAK